MGRHYFQVTSLHKILILIMLDNNVSETVTIHECNSGMSALPMVYK